MKYPGKSAMVALALLAATVVPGAAAGATLDTRVTMLTGSPGVGEEAASVLVIPGAVIPVARDWRQLNLEEDDAERTRELQEMSDKLRHAVGLERVEVAYSEVYRLVAKQPQSVTGPRGGSDIRGDLTLLDFNSELAVYRVEMRRGDEILADSKVAVERGGRAVVGGLDGAEAPYFFLVLQPAGKALFVKGDITHPRKVNAPSPLYTQIAKEKGIQGMVILQAVISEEGTVGEIEVLKGMPYGLTETAAEALRQWTFEPATLEGEPVAVYYHLTFNFRLKEKQKDKDG